MVVTVYSKPACVQCNATYRALDKKGLPHNKVDMSKDMDALDMARSLGHMQAPVVIVEKDGEIQNHWSGFDPEKIEQTAIDFNALMSEAV